MNNLVDSLKEKFDEIRGAAGSSANSGDAAPLVAGQEGVQGGARGLSPQRPPNSGTNASNSNNNSGISLGRADSTEVLNPNSSSQGFQQIQENVNSFRQRAPLLSVKRPWVYVQQAITGFN